jgi:serine/threonine protein kinase
MATYSTRGNKELYEPCEYKEDTEIPFEPDGKSPIIYNMVEKVRGTSGQFKDLRCVRKTIMALPTSRASRMTQRRAMIQEVKILYFAQHHHVIHLIHTYFEDKGENQLTFAVIMDRADRNLHSYLQPGNSPNRKWFGCLISVVHHIHALGIRHRDIKPANILIKGDTILLADFGISQMGLGKTMPTTNLHRNASRSREYCAPEVDEGRTRGRSADIFSLGAVFLEMLTAVSYTSGLQELNHILQPSSQHSSSYARNVSRVHKWIEERLLSVCGQDGILSVCRRMLDVNRYQRPSAEELNSTWFVISTRDESVACRCSLYKSVTNKLVEACRKAAEDEVKQLLSEGADPNTISAIHQAAGCGSEAIVQALLDSGAEVDLQNPVGQTALHCAARNGYEGVVRLLLQKGASVNAKDENEQTALQGAAAQGNEGIVRMLLESGADVDAEDLDGDTAVIFADRRDQFGVLSMLEAYKKDKMSI